MYWKCCEEKFCFDKTIATYKLEDETYFQNSKCYTNMGASFESVITDQPANNNHLPQNAISGHDMVELPLHANKLYEIFSKSMIFREEHELKKSSESLEDVETKSEPDYLSKPNRTKVYFEDEVNSPVTDFEIMFRDELQANHDMFKIDEEEELERRSPSEEGLTMNVSVKKQDVIKPSTVTIKEEPKMTTQNSVYKYDPNLTVVSLPSTLIPRVESVKSILRISGSQSPKPFERADSPNKGITRVDSFNLSPEKINKLLSRVPHRSASFLNIPEHLIPEKPQLTKSKSTIGVTSLEPDSKLSRLPDTPIIKSNNLPRFFTESPTLPEYREDTSLQSIQQKEVQKYHEDFSMPRYYKARELEPVHESKSMPDLRNPTSSGRVSKRLVKLRSKLKPLVIKKGAEEML